MTHIYVPITRMATKKWSITLRHNVYGNRFAVSQGILSLGLTNQAYESFTVYITFHVLFKRIGFEYDIDIFPTLNIVMNSMASVVTTDYQSCKSNQLKKGSKNH